MNLYREVRNRSHNRYAAYQANTDPLLWRLADVAFRTWDLGFSAFGGPPVHFQIWRRRFVEGRGGSAWVDQQTYQELFAISTAGPGPGSTKMLFALAWIRAGFFPALLVFFIWSLPGAIAMYALSLGIGEIDDVLPGLVYALLSGLNASIVGIIALSAVQLAEKAIKDRLTRILVIFGAVAGVCYDALWYFPVLIVIGASATVLWDLFLANRIGQLRDKWKKRKESGDEEKAHVQADGYDEKDGKREKNMSITGNEGSGSNGSAKGPGVEVVMQSSDQGELQRRAAGNGGTVAVPLTDGTAVRSVAQEEHSVSGTGDRKCGSGLQDVKSDELKSTTDESNNREQTEVRKETKDVAAGKKTTELSTDMQTHAISIRTGIIVTVIFIALMIRQTASFTTLMILRGVLTSPPRPLDLLASITLAGTIIFGGGPVVIPLLQSYVVEPGWVSARDFLIGLAIIQSFPGPNFNFGVYVGALALQRTRWPMILGAVIGYAGIFLPGMALTVVVQSVWTVIRGRRVVVSVLRGLNATAVGLVFTAVYRLWRIGYLGGGEDGSGSESESGDESVGVAAGESLGNEPWWIVLATLAYAEAAWFGTPPFVAILLGGLLGMAWYGTVGS